MFDAKAAIENFRARQRATSDRWAQRGDELKAKLPKLADTLRRQFGVTEIWLFGSLARGDYGPRSDVDLAVAGLDPARHWRAATVACQVLGCEVDLVAIDEDTPPSWMETLRIEGIKL